MCDPTGGANSSLAALSLYPSLPNCCGRAAAVSSSSIISATTEALKKAKIGRKRK